MALAAGDSIVRTGPLTLRTKAALRAVRSLTKVYAHGMSVLVTFQVLREHNLSKGLAGSTQSIQ